MNNNLFVIIILDLYRVTSDEAIYPSNFYYSITWTIEFSPSLVEGKSLSGLNLHFRRFVNDPGIIVMEEYCNSNIGKIIFIDFSETIDYFDVISMLIMLTNLYVPFFPPSERSLAY